MRGLMMDYQLTLRHVLERSYQLFPKKEVVSRVGDDEPVTRATYAEIYGRVHRLAGALRELGVKPGDRVATFAWNHQRHLELYLAVPCMGAVLHTVNVRLFPEQIAYIINHAGDKVVFVDPTCASLLEPLGDQLTTIEHVVVMGDAPPGGDRLLGRPTWGYEDLLAAAPAEYPFPDLPEDQAAAVCYTSGTTGNPKGVLYSHRAIVLHSLVEAMTDVMAISERDVVMPVVPMFHANCWGLPFTSTMVGATQVLPGPVPTPTALVRLIESERVTLAAGVPTVWLAVLAHLDKEGGDLSSLTRIMCGGSAAPRSLIEAYESRFGVPIWHAWGMTEMTPLGTVSRLKSALEDLAEAERFNFRATQGLPTPLVEMKAIDEEGREVPRDGDTLGELVVRGPWVTAGYYEDPEPDQRFTEDGWFRTGDVATIDSESYLQIVDRTKDLVKSGGEWISSVDLENALMAHPKVAEASVIAINDEKWGERPLACVVLRPDAGEASKEELLDFLRPKFARWWLPDDVVFLDDLPKTSVGKFDKKVLRDRYREYVPAPS
jgi:fatty-acyl-CoA synthase